VKLKIDLETWGRQGVESCAGPRDVLCSSARTAIPDVDHDQPAVAGGVIFSFTSYGAMPQMPGFRREKGNHGRLISAGVPRDRRSAKHEDTVR
jgi:hypothetical protein